MSQFSITGTVTKGPELRHSSAGVPFCGFHLVEDAEDAEACNPLRLDVIARGGLATRCAQTIAADSRVEVGGHLGRREMRRGGRSYPLFAVVATSMKPLDARPVEPAMARVVHCRQDDYDIYIGRGRCPRTDRPGEWGNPYSHKPSKVPGVVVVGSKVEAVERYERRLWEQIKTGRVTPEKLATLHGRTLGCWCMDACHGPVLARAAAWAHRRLAAA
jgi:primosomal replication protein N